tara:strand:+ start:13903 stop:14751 length:849 start_codon:yes stop_codon:yes gene_type:complete
MSESISLNPDINVWVTSSEMCELRPLSWKGWQTRPYLKRLYSTILNPSEAEIGAASWISSLRATRASLSARQVSNSRNKTPGTSGLTLPASSVKSSPAGSFSKTSKATFEGDLKPSAMTFEEWATVLRRDFSRRLKLAQATFDVGSSYWPTPTVSRPGNWPAVKISDQGIYFTKDTYQYGIDTVSRSWTLLWRLGEVIGLRPTRQRVQPTGSFPQVQMIFKPGNDISKRVLVVSPLFLEQLMGWLTGWTVVGSPVTGWSHWLLHMRTALSRLPSPAPEATST